MLGAPERHRIRHPGRHALSAAEQDAPRRPRRLRVAGVRRRTAPQVLQAHRQRQVATRRAERLLEIASTPRSASWDDSHAESHHDQSERQRLSARRERPTRRCAPTSIAPRPSSKDNPDRREIMAELEQAIAEKCQRFLGPNKSVVSAAEIEQIVREMGPVEGAATAGRSARTRRPGLERRRAVRGRRRRSLSDPRKARCGRASVTAWPPTSASMSAIVRIIFIVLTIASFGCGGFRLHRPDARSSRGSDTSDERAAALRHSPSTRRRSSIRSRSTPADFARSRRLEALEATVAGTAAAVAQPASRMAATVARARRTAAAVEHGGIPLRAPNYATPVWAGVLLPVFSLVSLALVRVSRRSPCSRS